MMNFDFEIWRVDITFVTVFLLDAAGEKSKQISQLEGEIQSLRHHLAVLQKDASKNIQ